MDEYFCRIFNLPHYVSESEIELFVNSIVLTDKIWMAKLDGKCAGFAWVKCKNIQDIQKLKEKLDGFKWKNNLLSVKD